MEKQGTECVKFDDLVRDDIDINQKRLVLQDALDDQQFILTNLLIYISQYYPKTKPLLLKTLINLLKKESSKVLLIKVTKVLSVDLFRQLIYGPSTTYIPPAQILHNQRLDSNLALHSEQDKQKRNVQNLKKALQELNLLEQVIPSNRVKELLWYSRSKYLSMEGVVKCKFYQKGLKQELQIGGENWIDATPLAGLLVSLKHICKSLIDNFSLQKTQDEELYTIILLNGRLNFLHNKILMNPVKQLSEQVFQSYQVCINKLKNKGQKLKMNEYVSILIEYSYALLFYYKYKKCQVLMDFSCQILNFQLEYTGKLGRRTKYQSFDTAQLIMNLKKRKTQKIQQKTSQKYSEQEQKSIKQGQSLLIPNAKSLVFQVIKSQIAQQDSRLKIATYDEQSILLQTPSFAPDTSESQNLQQQVKQEAPVIKQKIMVALALINYLWQSVPKDQMLYQYVSASIMQLLNAKSNISYPIHYSLLWLRSTNEFPRIKHSDRAIQQLEVLKAQFSNNSNKNYTDLFATPYFTHLGFVYHMSEKYMDLSLTLTAVELLKHVGMYQECVDGLIKRDYKEKALQIVTQIIQEKGKTPRLLCMLGDIHHNQPKYYQEAWQLSQKKYARAMRSLAWTYFNKQNYEKAAQCFTLATKVNYYHPSTWFTLGCCYIRLNQFEKALKPFGECICIDDTQGQAWGNIASCYMHLKKMKEAYSTLQQAVKHSQGNWKLWSNLLTVSLSMKQFFKYFQCIQKIVNLGHPQLITKEVLSKVVLIFTFKVDQCFSQNGRKRVLYNFKRRIQRLFQFMQFKIGQNPLVWQAKTSFNIQMLNYYTQLYKHYKKLHAENTLDLNDLIEDYETTQSVHYNTQDSLAQCKLQIVQCKQNHLNMTMRIGWDQNKIQCKKVKQIVPEYINVYNKYSKKQDLNDFNLFIKGIKEKIQKCLQQKIQFDLQEKT